MLCPSIVVIEFVPETFDFIGQRSSHCLSSLIQCFLVFSFYFSGIKKLRMPSVAEEREICVKGGNFKVRLNIERYLLLLLGHQKFFCVGADSLR